MKTIEERAKEWSELKEVEYEEFLAFIAGAQSEYEELTRWHDIPTDPKSGLATDDALNEIFRNMPCLVRDKQDWRIEFIDGDNAPEWHGDLERNPDRYQWREIHE